MSENMTPEQALQRALGQLYAVGYWHGDAQRDDGLHPDIRRNIEIKVQLRVPPEACRIIVSGYCDGRGGKATRVRFNSPDGKATVLRFGFQLNR